MTKGWDLGPFSLENRRFTWDLINGYKYLKGGCKKDRTRLFSVALSDRGDEHKPKERKSCLNIREHFFTVRVTENQNKLLREVVRVSPLGDIKKTSVHDCGQSAVGDPVWAGRLNQVTSRGSLQRFPPASTILWFCDSTTTRLPDPCLLDLLLL